MRFTASVTWRERKRRLRNGTVVIRIADLTTGAIRSWHAKLVTHVNSYTANLAQKFLRAALLMVAEDFQLKVPLMPSCTERRRLPDLISQYFREALLTSPQRVRTRGEVVLLISSSGR